MAYILDEDGRALVADVKKFCDNEVKEQCKAYDESGEWPKEIYDKAIELGYQMLEVPEEYGGLGLPGETILAMYEEMAWSDAGFAVTMAASNLALKPILIAGTEEQKQKFLRPLVDGSKIGCFGLTEPGAGTDASGVKTTAKLDGDHYVLNGQKVFTTNSGFADTFIIFAYTDKSAGTRGMSAFIVDRDSEGLTVSKDIPRMGIRAASNAEVALVDVKVPKENLIGREGMGYKIAMGALAGGRIGIGAQSVGIAQGALNEAIKYVKERKQFGRSIAQQQNTQFKLADMATRIEAAQMLVYKAAMAKANQKVYSVEAAKAKLFAAETAMAVTTEVVQLFGGYGYIREYDVERMMRDAKITEIYEGTSEVQRMVISGALLK